LRVAGPFVAVISAFASDASAQPAPTPPAALGPSSASTSAPQPLTPGAPAPLPFNQRALAGSPPPGQTYWPSYAPAYPPSPSFYGPEVPFSLPPATPKQPANRPLQVTGIVAAVGGVLTLITGSILMSIAKDRVDVYRDGPAYCCAIDDAPLRNAGITMLVIGGITATVGVPLWMIGGRRVPIRATTPDTTTPRAPARAAPLLRVGVSSAALSWQF
jgi:hypothetical protein